MESIALLLTLANANPGLELTFLPADADDAEAAGLAVDLDDGSTFLGNFQIRPVGHESVALGNFEIQVPTPDSDVVAPRVDPAIALPLDGLQVNADLGWAVHDVRVVQTPTPRPGPVLGPEDVHSVAPAAFVIDGIEVEGIVVLSDGRSAVGVLGSPVLPDGRDLVSSDTVHLVLQDPDRY